MRAGLLVLLMAVPIALAVTPAVASEMTPAVTSGDASASAPARTANQPPFDPDQLTAELLAEPVAVLPGSIARFDPARLDALTAGGDVKVLIAPPGPIDSDDNQAYRSALADVAEAVEDRWDGTVVRVTGIEVESVGQDRLDDIRHLLSTFEVTSELEFIAPYLRGGETGPSTDESVVDRTDPALVADLTARLRDTPVLVTDAAVAADPSAAIADPDQLARSWREKTGSALRLVVLPPLADGESAGVTAADLAPAFPGDAVVLVQGRWLDVAGPNRTAWTVARDMTLSRYEDFLQSRQVGPANTVYVLGNQYAELTSGAVQNQPTPVQRNPLSWLLPFLPVLALLLVVVFAVRHRSHRQARRAAIARHDDVAGLAEAAAALPALAQGILALDGLARSGPARDLLTTATMGYRSARRLVADGRDGAGATTAVRAARAALTDAADRLGVPHVPGTLPRADAVRPS